MQKKLSAHVSQSFQLSGSLLVVLFLLPGCSNYYGTSEYEQVRKVNESFSEMIAAAGGSAELKGMTMFGFQDAGWLIDLKGVTINDEIIAGIITAYGKDPVFQLKLSGSSVSNDQLEELDEAKVLQKVFIMDLSNTSISDDGLDKLDNLHCISELNLKGSKATLAGGTRLGERKVASPQTPKPMKKPPKIAI